MWRGTAPTKHLASSSASHSLMDASRLRLPDDNNYPVVSFVAVTVRAPGSAPVGHSGIFYRLGGPVHFLHLRWHNLLTRDIPGQEDAWVLPVYIEPERAKVIAGRCQQVWESYERTNSMPYSLQNGARFEATDGSLSLCNGTHGLNCANFVLRLFSSCGIELIDEATWQSRPGDAVLHKHLVGKMEADLAYDTMIGIPRPTTPSRQHIDCVRAEIGCLAFWPEEIAGACIYDAPLVAMSDCQAAGRIVLFILNGFEVRRRGAQGP